MIAVLGAGESGVGAALLAKQKGYDVFVSDSGSVKDHFQNELVSAGLDWEQGCLLYTSPSPRDATLSRMPSSA